MDFIIKLFASICILAGLAFLIIFIISIVIFRNARKNSDVRMSFEQFRRIYNLSPNKWYCYDDYIMRRKEYMKEDGNGIVCKEVSVSMKAYFDFLRLVVWQWKIDRAENKEETFAYEMQGLKTLSSMINKDAEEIQRKTQKEIEKLAKKIEEIHSNS
mgnify:CR=1 FL=1